MKQRKRSCEPPKVLKSNIRSMLANTQHGTEFKPATKKPFTNGDLKRLTEFKKEQSFKNSEYQNKQEERTKRILNGRKVVYVQ